MTNLTSIMSTISTTNAVTGETSCLVINKTLSLGQTFRLIGRDMAFIVTRLHHHPVAGAMVSGRTPDNRYGTTARVCDTAAA